MGNALLTGKARATYMSLSSEDAAEYNKVKYVIKKFTSKIKKDWDEYLPYLLFAYHEVPQDVHRILSI